MCVKKSLKLSKYQQLSIIILGVMLGCVDSRQVEAQTAGDVIGKMNPDQRWNYIAGVVEGLAFARWTKDKPDKTGMKCIYDWYYQGDKRNFNRTMTWLERHPDKPVGGLLYVLIKKDCGA